MFFRFIFMQYANKFELKMLPSNIQVVNHQPRNKTGSMNLYISKHTAYADVFGLESMNISKLLLIRKKRVGRDVHGQKKNDLQNRWFPQTKLGFEN